MVIRFNNGTEYEIDGINNGLNKNEKVYEFQLSIIMADGIELEPFAEEIVCQDMSNFQLVGDDQRVIRTYQGYHLERLTECVVYEPNENDPRGDNEKVTMTLIKEMKNLN